MSTSSNGDSSTSSQAWNGEPRVIYNDVLDRVNHLKRSRILTKYTQAARGTAAAAAEEEMRFVDVIINPDDLGDFNRSARRHVPDVTVVDARGLERRVSFRGGAMEPLPVGSVVVVRDKMGGKGLAAYLVGEEEHQVFITGNGVACSPTLLTQDLHNMPHEEAEEYAQRDPLTRGQLRNSAKQKAAGNGNNDHGSTDNGQPTDGDYATDEYDFYSEYYGATIGSWGGGGRGDFSKRRPQGAGIDGDPGVRDEMTDAKSRALGLREKALGMFMGDVKGGEGVGTVHGIFRQAADMGDPESFFYLALLQSAGLHGGEEGGGKGQAQTWALCGADAFSTNANLLLAYRFQSGHEYRFHLGAEHDEVSECREAVHFYQEAIADLREGREDASQDVYPPPDAYRLGGENGLGGWGVDIGGAGWGVGALGGGAGLTATGTGAGGGGGGGGGGGVGGGDGAPRDMEVQDDILLRAEAGDPMAIMILGYLYIVGSEEMAIKVDYKKAEQLMWSAVRSGEPGGYAYLAWMHHNGFIGGHLPPHLQPNIPEGGEPGDPGHGGGAGAGGVDARRDEQDTANPGDGGSVGDGDKTKQGDAERRKPKTEDKMREIATAYWGRERLVLTHWGSGVRSDEGGGDDAGGGAPKEEGSLLRLGEDVWGGQESDESWEWTVIGGGVSGAIAAVDLYMLGIVAGDAACATALADMWLHSEYSDSRDGTGAGGKWAMLQAHIMFEEALDMGRRYGEPQTIAALRVGSMWQWGLVPYMGINITKAIECYQESADNGGMDSLLALAELKYYGHEGVLDGSCEEGLQYYKAYADLCVKDGALAEGRAAFERGRYQEAFVHYLVAAEQGNKEGQASLAWLLDHALRRSRKPSSPSSSPLSPVLESSILAGALRRLGDFFGGDVSTESSTAVADGSGRAIASGLKREGLSGVVDTVVEMGRDPAVMAREYRRLAAEQGDADARCEIADELYEQAKATGVVPAGVGLLPWVTTKWSRERRDSPGGASRGRDPIVGEDVFFDHRGFRYGYGQESERLRFERLGDGARLLSDAVKYYRLSCETRGGGSRRALFSMGWLHQHGVGVSADPSLAREYYRRSGSAPAVLGLWIMGASDVVADIAAPLAISVVTVLLTVLFKRISKARRRRRSGNNGGGAGDEARRPAGGDGDRIGGRQWLRWGGALLVLLLVAVMIGALRFPLLPRRGHGTGQCCCCCYCSSQQRVVLRRALDKDQARAACM